MRSTDGGDTWDAINNGLTDLSISRFAIDPFDPAQLYAASGANTTNGGDQWHSFDNDFPEGRKGEHAGHGPSGPGSNLRDPQHRLLQVGGWSQFME